MTDLTEQTEAVALRETKEILEQLVQQDHQGAIRNNASVSRFKGHKTVGKEPWTFEDGLLKTVQINNKL